MTPTDAHPLTQRVRVALRSLPAPIRKVLVMVTGGVLIAVGLALVWLPGPFTLPFVLAGVAVLSTEYMWASSLLKVGQEQSVRLLRTLRNPWILSATLLGAAVIAITAYSVVRPGWWH